jgi:hypothetical protein
MNKLQISIGILAWKSGQTLVNTLETYHKNGLFNIINDACILFQEFSEQDEMIANHFGLSYIVEPTNIGIGAGFMKLTEKAKTDNVLVLEHDWKLIEDSETTYNRLKSGIELLNDGYDVVRYRHRNNPGYPHFSFKYKGIELDYYDDWHECKSPHLLDSIHWLDADINFPEYIGKVNEYFTTTSRYGNWTNNPCLYKRQFYLDTIEPFIGGGIDLERKIAYWWPRQNFKVAHGEGLFTHKDELKYGK